MFLLNFTLTCFENRVSCDKLDHISNFELSFFNLDISINNLLLVNFESLPLLLFLDFLISHISFLLGSNESRFKDFLQAVLRR